MSADAHDVKARHAWWRMGIPVSVLLSALYVGLHFVLWVGNIVTATSWSDTVYGGAGTFSTASIVSGVLLLVYLGLDFQRWRRRHGHWARYGYVIFGAAAVLVSAILLFLGRVAGLG